MSESWHTTTRVGIRLPEVDLLLAGEVTRGGAGGIACKGSYQRALEADAVVFGTRRALAELFGVSDVERIVFAANVTEALNLAMKGWLRPNDHVITTSMEHNAVWRRGGVAAAR